MASMFSFSKVQTSWHKPLSKPVSLSDGHVNGPMVKPFLHSQLDVVIPVTGEKAPTSFYI
jgi:hypothetical protein